MFLMPSLYEPCGLNQMYSMRYGTVPIVRATGGLDDTVQQFDPISGTGTGFKFQPYSGGAFLEKIREALYFYGRPETWQHIERNGMLVDNSWSAAAERYIELYQGLEHVHWGNPPMKTLRTVARAKQRSFEDRLTQQRHSRPV